jgi:hypothetical protein
LFSLLFTSVLFCVFVLKGDLCIHYLLILEFENCNWIALRRHSEHIRVENLEFCVKQERCEDIFCATNQILQIQRMSENNESVTQNADVTFHL